MKYRKLPVEVEVYLWEGNVVSPTKEELPLWLGQVITNGGAYFEWQNNDLLMVVLTLEGGIYVEKGDYIIQGVRGELYPCKPDIFEKTYESVR